MKKSIYDLPVVGKLFREHNVKLIVALAFILIVMLFFLFVDLNPDLSHLDIKIYSGSEKGNYHAIARRASRIARKKNGTIENIISRGSMDNVELLIKGKKSGTPQFAFVQNGILPHESEDLELIAQLTFSETVFFLGPNAGSIINISDLNGKHIGIGATGSGTEHLARQIFSSPGFKNLKVKLSNYSIEKQLMLLRNGTIDLAIFVIAENAAIIEKAMSRYNMQIASFRQAKSIAKRLPYLNTGTIHAGYYDPLRNIPARDTRVLQVDTLIVGNGTALRSDTIGFLTTLSELFPNLINYNRNTPNMSGMILSEDARRFYDNQGPEPLDRYAPLLVNYIPLGTLVQFAMIISILFNIMGAGNRFCLWRIDANRIMLENNIRDFFGPGIIFDEIKKVQPLARHNTTTASAELQGIIEGLESLIARCRKQSQSILVPMGKELGYRYQETIIENHLVSLRAYSRKLSGKTDTAI